MPVLLTAENLTKSFTSRPLFENLSFTIAEGDHVGLVGPNGSGKSTLLKTLLGLIPVLRGSLGVLGTTPGSSPARVAYLRQAHSTRFVVPVRALDVVRMGRFASLGLLRRVKERDHRLVTDAMEQMGIAHLADQPLQSLSGGQQQRVYLAQVLAHDADLLVLDEPTSGLDLAGRERYRALLRSARERGAAVVTATHDIAEASECDQVLLLNRRIIAQGSPAEVLNAEHLLETFGITLQRFGHELDGHLMIGDHLHDERHRH